MSINKKIEKRVLTRMQRASLHLLEAAHICWNNDERGGSDAIREVSGMIDRLSQEMGGSLSMKIRRELIAPKKKK